MWPFRLVEQLLCLDTGHIAYAGGDNQAIIACGLN
jgi:hypothetical protein